jgi:hypothetical protein
MGKYLDLLKRAVVERTAGDISDESDKTVRQSTSGANFGRFGRFGRRPQAFSRTTLEALERRCPQHVDRDRWQQAVEDGQRFLVQWGEKAATLGWNARDLFGLQPLPNKPTHSYRRLSRYDQTGLVWLLQGRPVVALTDLSATIRNSTGTITVYRKDNKPAFGPVGDCLDDFYPERTQ